MHVSKSFGGIDSERGAFVSRHRFWGITTRTGGGYVREQAWEGPVVQKLQRALDGGVAVEERMFADRAFRVQQMGSVDSKS